MSFSENENIGPFIRILNESIYILTDFYHALEDEMIHPKTAKSSTEKGPKALMKVQCLYARAEQPRSVFLTLSKA